MHPCSLCGGASTGYKDYEIYDDRYGYPDIFQLTKCSSCGHIWLNADFTPEQLKKLYTDYYPRASFNITYYRPSKKVRGFMAWLNGERRLAYTWVPQDIRILDIGCGFAETLGYHRARGCDVYGVEADENIRGVVERFGFNVHIGLFDPSSYEPEFFDYVTMDQVIEHVADPLEALRGVVKVLKPNGRLVISTPNANGWGAKLFGRCWINWHAPYHLHHFSVQSMKYVAEKAGLNIEWHKTVTSSDWLYFQCNHLLTFPVQGQPSAFWSPSAQLNKRQFILAKLLFLIHAIKINHVLTRFFDALGIGDNYLFFLIKK